MLNFDWYNILYSRLQYNDLSPFTIICGSRGAGKTYALEFIVKNAQRHGYNVRISEDNKIESVRSIITESYNNHTKTIYMFDDVDSMSIGAKNALLKITEEPPNNALFIVTLTDLDNMLETIKSRAEIMSIPPYVKVQLLSYCTDVLDVDTETANIIVDVCNTPGECELLKDNVKDFTDYIELVYNNIHTVTGANSFRIGSKLDLDGKGGYDLDLFFRGFEMRCFKDFQTDIRRCTAGVRTVAKYRQDLRINGINKTTLFDCFVLDIRANWMYLLEED